MTIPPFHWWRTVFYLIPAISVYTIVLGAASLVSSLFSRHGHFAHKCAQLWSRLILVTTGVRVSVEGLDRVTPGAECCLRLRILRGLRGSGTGRGGEQQEAGRSCGPARAQSRCVQHEAIP